MDETNIILDKHLNGLNEKTRMIEEQLEATSLLIEKGISQTLNKREMISAMCLQGVLGNCNVNINTFAFNVGNATSNAVSLADALLDELERTKK